jgi:hypothetical protein
MHAKNVLRALAIVAALVVGWSSPAAAHGNSKTTAETKCHMTYSLTEWAVAFEHAKGHGQITCDDGQAADVEVLSQGVGITAGKYRVDGTGEFSKVHRVNELFGSYAAAEGQAGLRKAGQAAVVTKGKVSLALAGHGEGWTVGVSVGRLEIQPSK